MKLVIQGLTSKQIARQLGISPSTVDNHVRAVIERLGATSRLDAARILTVAMTGSEPVQKLPNSSSSSKSTSEGSSFDRPIAFKLVQLPPFGGSPNRLRIVARFLHVIQIALIATMSFAAITATIAGIVNLFVR
jgi:hypothetical protein